MKKKILSFLFPCALILLTGTVAKATLITLPELDGERVILDADAQLYWMWDLTAYANQTRAEQLSSIEAMNEDWYYGRQGWRLATAGETGNMLITQALNMPNDEHFNPSVHEGHRWVWNGRTVDEGGDINGVFYLNQVDYGNWKEVRSVGFGSAASPELGVWVVARVPENQTAGLLLSGLFMGMVIIRKRKTI